MADLVRRALASLPSLHPDDQAWFIGPPTAAHPDLARRMTSTYRSALEAAGWDVDMLAHHATAAQHTNLVTVTGDRIEVRTSTTEHLNTRLRDVPGMGWDGKAGCWYATLHPRTARHLRAALTGFHVSIDGPAAATLATEADRPLDPEVGVGADHIWVRTPTWRALADDLKRIPGAHWADTHWAMAATPAVAVKVQQLVTRYELIATPDLAALADAGREPFLYDGTIQGLVGVPLTDVHAIASVEARGKTAALVDRLAKVGLTSVWDLLMHIPLRYIDRNNRITLAMLGAYVGDEVSVLAHITDIKAYDTNRKMTRLTLGDGTGFLEVTYFRSPWINKQFRRGDHVLVHGKVSVYQPRNGGRGRLQMANPMMDALGGDAETMVPVYPQSEKSKVSTWDIHRGAIEAVDRLGDLVDPLPEEFVTAKQLIGRKDAFRRIHAPSTSEDVAAARRRLAFDELLRMQLVLGIRRNQVAAETGVIHQPTGDLTSQYLSRLPYSLTGAQQRALKEIVEDLASPHPMNRMLQGDVGAGKSLCAAVTLLAAVEGGFQTALMAPTEILATQLHAEMAEHFTHLTHPETGGPVIVEFLGGKTTIKNKRRILAGLADGSVHLVVGTHALLSDDVTFANLGLVVVDEQHRFGVDQRAKLRAKGLNASPDMLAMTATPIPRTAALTIFADLEQSILDELPPGRTPIRTSWLPCAPPLHDNDAAPWVRIRDQVAQGRQAYVVASLVEDNEKLAAASATETFEALQHGPLAGLHVGLVHGQMHRDEREQTMGEFKEGRLDVLVATTVIEVGVNVPNATVMVVLDAARFGIAQLHQIRGRVGRGQHASECILIGEAGSDEGRTRMEALVESTDGFYLSEVDLKLRGSGALFGTAQSGQSDLRVAKLPDDVEMVSECREYARHLLERDPQLLRRPMLRAEVITALGEDAGQALAAS